jgi:NitT/TauT family transport system permease protein
VPLFIILLGFGDAPIILVIIIAAFFPMTVSVMNAVEQVDPVRVDVARLLGASQAQLVSKVYAPEVIPAIITGAQVGFGNAWRSLIAAEMVGGVNVGLGWFITFSGEVADMVGVLAGIFVIGFFSAVLDGYILERLKRRLLRWKYV